MYGVTTNAGANGSGMVYRVNTALPLQLKWPLAVARSGVKITLPFGGQSPLACSDGTKKEHNGSDYDVKTGTIVGMTVYAAEVGVVKQVLLPDQTKGWAQNVVIEHHRPNINTDRYTTVSWHVVPKVKIGDTVTKGQKIGMVADLAVYKNNSHFHLGIRMGPYTANASGYGALPYADHPCDGYSVFPAGFINPENTALVLFK